MGKATRGNYVALLTGMAGGADDVQHVTMRRQLADAEPQAPAINTPPPIPPPNRNPPAHAQPRAPYRPSP